MGQRGMNSRVVEWRGAGWVRGERVVKGWQREGDTQHTKIVVDIIRSDRV